MNNWISPKTQLIKYSMSWGKLNYPQKGKLHYPEKGKND